jgi:hypothetical protein
MGGGKVTKDLTSDPIAFPERLNVVLKHIFHIRSLPHRLQQLFHSLTVPYWKRKFEETAEE